MKKLGYFSTFVQKSLYPSSMKLFCNFIITWKRKRKVTSYFKDVCTKLPLKKHALYFLLLVNIFRSIICTVKTEMSFPVYAPTTTVNQKFIPNNDTLFPVHKKVPEL